MADLTTLVAVKNWLAIPAPQTGSDASLAALITSTSADFLRAIDRFDLLSETYTEVREGDGGSRLPMRHWPITAVASVGIGGVSMAPSPDMVAPGYYFDDDLDPERCSQLYLAGGAVFKDGAIMSITYTAGYTAVPPDVAQAVVDWVAARYKGRPGQQISSQRDAGGEHVAYDKEAAMPATTAAVADRYLRKWPSLDKRNDDRDYRNTRINRNFTYVERAQ